MLLLVCCLQCLAVKANVSNAAHIAPVACHIDRGFAEQFRATHFFTMHAHVDALPAVMTCQKPVPVLLRTLHLLHAMLTKAFLSR